MAPSLNRHPNPADRGTSPSRRAAKANLLHDTSTASSARSFPRLILTLAGQKKLHDIEQTGINLGDPVAFYAPMELATQPTEPHATANVVFFGSKHLYWGGGYGSNPSWTLLTPGVQIPTGPFPDINISDGNVITAIANAPSNQDRVYIGYYDGTVFTSANVTAPSPTWTRIDQSGIPLPDRVVTAIAVHPGDELRAYVALSGFSTHSVYLTPNGGGTWEPFDANSDSDDAFATRPVNALTIRPDSPNQMFAGTDEGVYSRATADQDAEIWTKSVAMPHVAVYDFANDPTTPATLFAATHGRGVWRLSAGNVMMSAGKVYGSSGFSAGGFEAYRNCRLTLLSGGQTCSVSDIDADGAALTTNAVGNLVATKPGAYTERLMGWACLDGLCAGGFLERECPVDQVQLHCGGQMGDWRAADSLAPEIRDPGSSQLAFRPAFVGGAATARACEEHGPRLRPGRYRQPCTVNFRLRPTLLHPSGANEVLCEVNVTFSWSDDVETVLQRAASLVNDDPVCARASVTASVVETSGIGPGEDSIPVPFRLVLSTSGRVGLQVLTSIMAGVNAELGVGAMGAGWHVAAAPRLTLSGTARGGAITLSEQTPLGQCKVTVTTKPGESASSVTGRIRSMFSSPEAPSPWCLEGQNPRDAIIGQDRALRFVSAQSLGVENTDPGLRYAIDGES